MEIYETNTQEDCESVSDRILTALKTAELIPSHETKYCNGMVSTEGKYGLRIWAKYRDTIIGELTTEEESKLKTITTEDVLWFPNTKSENDTKLNS